MTKAATHSPLQLQLATPAALSPARVRRGPSTEAVHAGRADDYPYHALNVPVVQTATYTFRNTADLCEFQETRMWGGARDRTEYGRYGNPTVAACEAKLAALDHGEDAVLFSSGMNAVTTVLLAMLSAGTHLIIGDDCYRRTRQFCKTYLKKFGIETTVVPMGDLAALEAAIRPNTRLIVSESPTNPYLRVVDLVRLVEIAKRHGVKTLIDSTFASPVNQTPLDFGVDLVLHSATKYLSGHNDLLAGVVVGKAGLIDSLRQALGVLGGVADPHTAALLLRGLKTLALRVERQNRNAQAVAEFLEAHPRVKRVWYPGLASHPDHAIARAQMLGYGGVVSFEIDGSLEDTSRFIDAMELAIIAPSLGGVETLIEQPALMSYYELSTEERSEVGIKDNLVRLACGVEDTEDLIADLAQALDR
ncbi:MAG: aminotransferase class I/II-fold pyridoxal phosphate-dependent enzyme [Anaerolineales bacterium]|nr:aminotransferase class I/II-fold pyridoxal phosphate-dependent enzyme [Anaerolineales bacterium]